MLETLLDTEKEATELSDKTQNIMIDDNELMEHLKKNKKATELSDKIQNIMIDDNEPMEHLKKTTEFNMSLKKAKRKLQIFLEYQPEMRDFKRNDRYGNEQSLLAT